MIVEIALALVAGADECGAFQTAQLVVDEFVAPDGLYIARAVVGVRAEIPGDARARELDAGGAGHVVWVEAVGVHDPGAIARAILVEHSGERAIGIALSSV